MTVNSQSVSYYHTRSTELVVRTDTLDLTLTRPSTGTAAGISATSRGRELGFCPDFEKNDSTSVR